MQNKTKVENQVESYNDLSKDVILQRAETQIRLILDKYDVNGFLANGWRLAIERGYLYPTTFYYEGEERNITNLNGLEYKTTECGCLITEAALIMDEETEELALNIRKLVGTISSDIGSRTTLLEKLLFDAGNNRTNQTSETLDSIHSWIEDWMLQHGFDKKSSFYN